MTARILTPDEVRAYQAAREGGFATSAKAITASHEALRAERDAAKAALARMREALETALRTIGHVTESRHFQPWTHPTLGLQDPGGVHRAYEVVNEALRPFRTADNAAFLASRGLAAPTPATAPTFEPGDFALPAENRKERVPSEVAEVRVYAEGREEIRFKGGSDFQPASLFVLAGKGRDSEEG